MSAAFDREHFIPLRRDELVELLCSDPTLTPGDGEQFRQFCRLLAAIYHFEFNQRLDELKTAYTPFDPDCDTKSLVKLSAGKDLGPEKDDSIGLRDEAARKWRAWWAEQGGK